jgi:outer membrane autotransporter protein
MTGSARLFATLTVAIALAFMALPVPQAQAACDPTVRMPLGGNLVLTPAARLRYLAANFGGYSQTGSAQNLTVASRNT